MKILSKDRITITEIDWATLERIAEYYEFPVAAFFLEKESFVEKTRKEGILKKRIELREKLIELIDEYLGD